MKNTGLVLNVSDRLGVEKPFQLGTPVSVGRRVLLQPEVVSSNCFYMPKITTETLVYTDQFKFTAAVAQGGSCNVDILRYVPHGLTHVETSAHVLPMQADSFCLDAVSPEQWIGLTYLLDLSQEDFSSSNQIPWEPIQERLEKLELPISILAIKTKASVLPWDYDFSSQDFLSLSLAAAQGIHDHLPCIHTLMLDLPSIDPERDGGKLLGHRLYFGLSSTERGGVDTECRLLVELAWFNALAEGYYYSVITPPRFQTHAVCTDILFFPLV